MSRYLDPDLDGREAGHITGRWGVEAQENRSGKTASKADALFWVLLLHLFKLLLSRKKKVTVCKMTLTLITFSYGWYLAFWAPPETHPVPILRATSANIHSFKSPRMRE